MKTLSTELCEFLKRCGLPAKTIAQCNNSTRMYHDLGVYGDVAETCMGVLADQYHVDLRGFEFEKFFPSEFIGKTILTRTLFWLLPFIGDAARKRGNYLPLTLEMVDQAIRTKQWTSNI